MTDPIDRLANFYDNEEVSRRLNQGDSPRTAFLKELKASEKDTCPLPKVVADSPEYSSTLAMLQRTREGVKEFSKQHSALDVVLQLPCTMELKRTIARMFADPKNAAEISKGEWRRREEKYNLEKQRTTEMQAEQLRKDRATLAKELEHLRD
eukprot:Sspe_Gene.87444::Locus_58720_Transcript_1_1_Confidence_1.000_Length_627::g.87444::m.87444